MVPEPFLVVFFLIIENSTLLRNLSGMKLQSFVNFIPFNQFGTIVEKKGLGFFSLIKVIPKIFKIIF